MNKEVFNKTLFKTSDPINALYREYVGDHNQLYATMGCRVERVISFSEGMVSKNIEDGTYLKSRAKGNILQGKGVQSLGMPPNKCQ